MVRAKLFGLKEAQRWAELSVKAIERDADKALTRASNNLVRDARNRANETGSQRVKSSIKAEVSKNGQSRSLLFYIDTDTPDLLIPSKRYGLFNLGWGMNDGTYEKYKRGAISPSANTIGAVPNRKGLKSIDFMGYSWKRNIPKLYERLEQILIKVK
jgi:hypothetical protein